MAAAIYFWSRAVGIDFVFLLLVDHCLGVSTGLVAGDVARVARLAGLWVSVGGTFVLLSWSVDLSDSRVEKLAAVWRW